MSIEPQDIMSTDWNVSATVVSQCGMENPVRYVVSLVLFFDEIFLDLNQTVVIFVFLFMLNFAANG